MSEKLGGLNMNKKELKKIIKEKSRLSTPDLCEKIEEGLVDKDNVIKEIKLIKKKSNKKKYLQIGLVAAIFCLVVIVKGVPIGSAIEEIIEKQSKEPVLYSSLNLGEVSEVAETYGEDSSKGIYASADMAMPTEEGDFVSSNIVCKATVINMYKKEYNYSVYNNKFEVGGKFKYFERSNVYEVRIDKLFYSEGTVQEGDIIKIEEYEYFGTSLSWEVPKLQLKKDNQYIFPLQKLDENISTHHGEYAEGDIKREGQYVICTSVPIAITKNKEYVFSSIWESLIDENTVDVIKDNEEENKAEEVMCWDQIKLRRDEGFEDDFMEMVKKHKTN